MQSSGERNNETEEPDVSELTLESASMETEGNNEPNEQADSSDDDGSSVNDDSLAFDGANNCPTAGTRQKRKKRQRNKQSKQKYMEKRARKAQRSEEKRDNQMKSTEIEGSNSSSKSKKNSEKQKNIKYPPNIQADKTQGPFVFGDGTNYKQVDNNSTDEHVSQRLFQGAVDYLKKSKVCKILIIILCVCVLISPLTALTACHVTFHSVANNVSFITLGLHTLLFLDLRA